MAMWTGCAGQHCQAWASNRLDGVAVWRLGQSACNIKKRFSGGAKIYLANGLTSLAWHVQFRVGSLPVAASHITAVRL